MSFKAQDLLYAPVTTGGAVEQVFRRVGEAIGAGQLAAGDQLPTEADLARRLHVAPMTVRHALAALRSEGYIETRRGRGGGSFVRKDAIARLRSRDDNDTWSLDRLDELTVWRRAVSGEAASLAALRASEPQIHHLLAVETGAREHTAEPNAYRVQDAQFHVLIAEMSASRRLIAAEVEIQNELSALIAPVPGAEIVRVTSGHGHTPIVDHIQRRNSEHARSSVGEHVEATRDWLIGLHLGGVDSKTEQE